MFLIRVTGRTCGILEMLDPSLFDESSQLEEIKSCIKIGLACVYPDPSKRPTRNEVVRANCGGSREAKQNATPAQYSDIVNELAPLIERGRTTMWRWELVIRTRLLSTLQLVACLLIVLFLLSRCPLYTVASNYCCFMFSA
jgi:hypothetical protein